jgi:predicted ATPase
MSKIESLRVQGYRRLVDAEVKLGGLNVMIGANGAGKTSLLEVWSLLSAACEGKLAATISSHGGIGNLLTVDRAKAVQVDVSMDFPGQAPLDYHLSLEPQANSYQIRAEVLEERPSGPLLIQAHGSDIRYWDVGANRLVRPTWDHSPLETSLSQVPKMFQATESFRKSLASCACYGPLNVSPKAPVRMPQAMQPAALPGANGEDLVSCLYTLRETARDRFEALEDALSAAFPDFERLDFPPVAAGTLSMTWKDKHFSKPLYTHQLSEGTLRFLWLAAILQSTALPTVTLIDEPEVSMHPELLRLLVDLLRDAAQRTQLIVATHSDRLVRFLEPEEVLAADLVDGQAVFTRGSDLDLERWLEEYALDELWQMGRLGGRS